MLGGVAHGMLPKSGLFAVVAADVKRPHGRKRPSEGPLPPARGDLDDFVTSPMHDGTRWAVPRTARRAVVGLGVARRPAWVGHAAPIVTRGRHVFTEAGRVHGSWRAPRGDDSRPRSPPSLVSGTPPPSIPCGVSSGLTRPSLSRRCASFASRRVHVGPLATLRQCVCVNMPKCVLICLICI